MPQALQRARARALSLALALVLALVPRPARATRAMGAITFPMPESVEQNVTATLPSLAASAFGFGVGGRFTGTFGIHVDAAASCVGTVALCDVTDFIRRDLTFQRRLIPLSKRQVEEDIAVAACGGQESQIRCITSEFGNGSTKVSFSQKELGTENRIWRVNFAICPKRCDDKLTDKGDRQFIFDVHMVNGDGMWRELGWEELVFPAASAFVVAVASASWLAVTSIWLWRALVARRRRRVVQSQQSISATPVPQSEVISGFAGGDSSTPGHNRSRLQRWSARAERRARQPPTSTVRSTRTRAPRPLPFELKLLFFAASAKLASSGLVCAYFWTVVKTGARKSWYTPLRFPFLAMDDAAVTLLMLFMSTGEHSVPKAWIVDGRGGSLVIWINMSLQVIVFFLVKVMFPYRYLGFSIQFMFGLFIYGLTAYCSVRNARFLGRYAALIEKARIVVKSTPIPRMRLFFLVNAHILAFVWVVKVVAVGFFDSMRSRPDLLWALFELADSLLLAWYTISVWPRAGSSLYVDLTHVDNTRLLEVERRRQQVAGLEAGERPSVSTDLSTEASDTLNRRREVEVGSPRVVHAMAGSDATTLSDGGSVMSASVENGNAVAIPIQNDPEQLEWVYWVSGMSLPVPTASLWGSRHGIAENVQDGAFASSGRRPEPKALPLYNVFGSPTAAVDKLMLSVGVPVAGPLALESDSSRNSPPNDSENGKAVFSRSDARDPRTSASSASFPRNLLGSMMGARSAHIAAMREANESPEPDGIHHDAQPASSEQHAALQEGESEQERQSSTLTAASADGQVWSAGNV